MSENWTREHMVEVYGEAGADAMRKLSDAYARIEELEGWLKDEREQAWVALDGTNVRAQRERIAELEALLREAYEDDHRGHDGPVGDLGERIHAALGRGERA